MVSCLIVTLCCDVQVTDIAVVKCVYLGIRSAILNVYHNIPCFSVCRFAVGNCRRIVCVNECLAFKIFLSADHFGKALLLWVCPSTTMND